MPALSLRGAFQYGALLGLAFVPGLACARRPTPADCDAVLDHYVEMLVREQNPGLEGEKLRLQTERTRAQAAKIPSFSSCVRQIDADAVRCAMVAPNVDELEKCLE